MEENNEGNLIDDPWNPEIEKFKSLTDEQREKLVNDYNKKPEVNKNDFKLIDEKEDTPVNKTRLKWLNLLSIFGIIALIIFSIAGGIYAYTIYKDKTLLSPVANMICGNVNLTCEKTECNIEIPSCDCPINNCNINITCPTVNIYTNQT